MTEESLGSDAGRPDPTREMRPDEHAPHPKYVRTRKKILDAAAHVLSVKGYAGTRLSDVAQYADIQAPAIYCQRRSKTDPFSTVEN